MRTEHHNFIGLVRSRDFADNIEGIQILVVKLVLNIHLEPNGNLLFEQAPDAAVVFNSYDSLRRNRRIARIPAAATLHKYGSAAAGTRLNGCHDAFIDQKPQPAFVEALVILAAPATTLAGLDRLVCERVQVLIRKSAAGSFKQCGHVPHGSYQYILSAQLAAKLVEILFVGDDGGNHIARDRTIRAGCPGLGIRNQRKRRR